MQLHDNNTTTKTSQLRNYFLIGYVLIVFFFFVTSIFDLAETVKFSNIGVSHLMLFLMIQRHIVRECPK